MGSFLQLIVELGLTIPVRLSVLVLTRVVFFLGFILFSVFDCIFATSEICSHSGSGYAASPEWTEFSGIGIFLWPWCSLRSVGGLASPLVQVSGFVRVEHLVIHKNNYVPTLPLDAHAKDSVSWWICHVLSLYRSFLLTLTADLMDVGLK